MKKNIIFIIVDTLRVDALGIYGNPQKPSPNIDRLAQKGIVFTNAYASITKTDPSITSIFSGQYPTTIGLISHGQWIDKQQEKNIEKIKLLPEILKENGYQTMAVDWLARWHKRGYENYSGKILPDASTEGLIKDKFFYLKFFRKIDRLFLVPLFKRDFLTRLAFSSLMKNPIPYDPADVVVDQAIDYLEKKSDKPFFLYLHFWDPHWPHTQPKRWLSTLFDSVLTRYLAEVKFVDEHLGRFFSHLLKKNLLKNTLIIITGDHGESLTEHGLNIAHQALYEEVVKVPLILYHHSFRPRKIKALVAHVDLVPTVLDFLKIKAPIKFEGYSLLSLIKGRRRKVRDFVFYIDIIYPQMKIKKARRRRGIRKGDYKYIQYLKVDDYTVTKIVLDKNIKLIDEELFNLKRDPREQENLAAKEMKKKQELKKLLEKQLARMRKKCL